MSIFLSQNVYYVMKASLSILHNIARNSGMKHLFDENKTSEVIQGTKIFLYCTCPAGRVTTELSKLLTSCLTAVKKHVIKYCEKVYERSGKNLFWSIKNSGEILDKLKARDFNATSLSTYDFSTLYTTLPHNLIKDKLIDLIERTFQREGSPYLACSDRNAFFTSEKPKKYHAWSIKMYVMR